LLKPQEKQTPENKRAHHREMTMPGIGLTILEAFFGQTDRHLAAPLVSFVVAPVLRVL